MLAVERRLKILERVAEDQSIEVGALARDFDVSEMTIRRGAADGSAAGLAVVICAVPAYER